MVKQIITGGVCLLLASAVCAKALPLAPEGKQEEALYMKMLQGFVAEQQAEQAGCPYYEQALEQAPQSKLIKRELLLCALAANQPTQAAQYADFIAQEPNDATDLAAYAFYKWRTGDLQAAQHYYQQALEQAPDNSQILSHYILLLSSLDIEKAAQELQKRKASFVDMAAVLDYQTGNLYYQRKQWAEALHYYHLATQEQPSYPEPYLARAEIYEHTAQYFLMMHELQALEKMGYATAAMYGRMGSFYVLAKEDALAKDYFLKAYQLDSSNDTAGYFLATYAEEAGDFAQAAQYLSQTAGYPTQPGKWLQVSFYQQRTGNTAAALQTLQQAYEHFPQQVEIGYFYGLLLQDVKQYRRSAQVLKQLVQEYPSYENARLAYAFALESLGKYKEMEQQLRQLLVQNPSNAAAYNLWGFTLAERNIRLEEAQELVTKALALRPQDRAFIDSLAWVYYRQQKYEKARALLESLDTDFITQNPEVAYHWGAVYAALGETEKSIGYLQQAAQTEKEAARLLKKLNRHPSAPTNP